MRGIVPLDPAVNPGFLKLDLLCRGARLEDSCRVEGDGGRPVLRTRAGLGSGLELVLPGDLWVNVPVVESFAKGSPYSIGRRGGAPSDGPAPEYEIRYDGAPCATARLAPRPAWYDRETSAGRPMRRVGTLQGTYLAIYPGKVCDFWTKGPGRPAPERCRFCSVGLNLGADDAHRKTVDEVLEVVHAARRESGITYVDFNSGHDDAFGFLDDLEPYVRRVKEETGLLVGVQTPPHPDRSHWIRVKEMGVNRVSFCLEQFDRGHFAALCPGKARVYGLDAYLNAIEFCASLATPSRFAFDPWVTNGEIIAGLEPPDRSVAAIDWMTERGAIPTVCVFRPLVGTDMAGAPSPRTEDMLPVFQALYERCTARDLPIGVAPNVHVSLVMLPEECRWLVQDAGVLRSLRSHERARAWKRRAFRALFAARSLKRRPAVGSPR